MTSPSCECRPLSSVETPTISLSRATYQASQKRRWNFSLDVMYDAMDIRQPDDVVDFEMDEFCARRLTAGVSAAQPDKGAGAGYQASTQLHPVVIEARSAEMTTGRSPGR